MSPTPSSAEPTSCLALFMGLSSTWAELARRVGGSGPGAGAGELGGHRGGEQGRVRADCDEGPAFGQSGRRGGSVVDQQSTRFAIGKGRVADLCDGGNECWGGEIARDAEIVAEVSGSDEQDVGAVERRDLV